MSMLTWGDLASPKKLSKLKDKINSMPLEKIASDRAYLKSFKGATDILEEMFGGKFKVELSLSNNSRE